MVVAKNDIIHDKLSVMIKNKEVEREYLALVWGVVRHEKGKIDAPIGRDFNDRQKYAVTDINGKESVTHFKVIERYKNATIFISDKGYGSLSEYSLNDFIKIFEDFYC